MEVQVSDYEDERTGLLFCWNFRTCAATWTPRRKAEDSDATTAHTHTARAFAG